MSDSESRGPKSEPPLIRRSVLRRFDAVYSSVIGSMVFVLLTELLEWYTAAPIPPLGKWVTLAAFLLAAHSYRRLLHLKKVKAFGGTHVLFYVDFLIFGLLLTTVATASSWAMIERRLRLELLRPVEPSLNVAIAKHLKARSSLREDTVDEGYSYDRIIVNLHQAGRTAIVQHLMLGEARSQSDPSELKVGYSGDSPIEDISRFISLELLDKPELASGESVLPISRRSTPEGVDSVVFTFPGFKGKRWIRRTVCWPGALYRANDAFLIDLSDYRYFSAPYFEINLFSTKRIHASIFNAEPDPRGGGEALLTYIKGVRSIPPNVAYADWSNRLGAQSPTTSLAWQVPTTSNSKVFAVVYEPALETVEHLDGTAVADLNNRPVPGKPVTGSN